MTNNHLILPYSFQLLSSSNTENPFLVRTCSSTLGVYQSLESPQSFSFSSETIFLQLKNQEEASL